MSDDARDRAREARQNASVAEEIVWKALRNSRIGFKFRREHEVDRYRLDFYCREAMLAVEMDGEQHDPERDALRDEALAKLGLRTYRIPNRRFFMLDESPYKDEIGAIQRLCEERSGRKAFPD
ncbi:hypothetical protein BH11ARM2_BH11ARM2_23370 [soil metagenome]